MLKYAYEGIIKDGKIILFEPLPVPDQTKVTVMISDRPISRKELAHLFQTGVAPTPPPSLDNVADSQTLRLILHVLEPDDASVK